ncbi:hypothetical protein, partial [Allorhizocola rhizosphaerae]|uniref:hypothetical protein n=1 Tax=Allorhizocola rhizosphaerae TaxID=1872709 RepID=UPI001B8BC438
MRRGCYALLTALLCVVLLDPWLQAAWAKMLKNGLLLELLVFVLVIWRYRPAAHDYALGAVALVVVLSGLLGLVPAVVIGQALWVYLRGAVVLYAILALRPSERWIRAVLWTAGVWVGLNCVVALAQVLFGWVEIHRAQGFYEHPNDLGHLCGLALLGTLVWKHRFRWAAAALFAAGLAATQSRESLLGVMAGAVVIALHRRVPVRRLAAGLGALLALAAVPVVVLPDVRTEVARRFWGVVD